MSTPNVQSQIAELNEALKTLYSNSNSQVKDQANDYLLKFQRSEPAWSLIFPVLGDEKGSNTSNPQEDLQLKIFMAQTLRSKVHYDFNQLPSDSLGSLKDSLIQLIIAYDGKQKLITTQLCIALANFALQFLSWNNAVVEIIEILSANSTNSLLEFLKVLPEELLDVKKVPLSDEELRLRTKQLVDDNIQQVLYVLSSFATNQASSSTSSLVLSCIKSWISEIPIDQILSNSSLCPLIFNSISNDDTFDTAIECLSTIIAESREIDNLDIIRGLYEQLLNLKPFLMENSDDIDKMEPLVELFATAGESWYAYIARMPVDFKPLVEILLQLTAYEEDLDIVKYTFKFWFDLKQLLVLDSRKEARQVFTPIYAQLIEIILNHLCYPLTSDSINTRDLFENKEAEDKFKDFRYDMGDVLKDCCAVIGAQSALQIPFAKLQNFMNLQSQGQQVLWQNIEAPLFSMRAMAKEVTTNENVILPQIMDYLVKLPENPKVRYAATLVLGRYTEWTAKHPAYLEKQLTYITSGFEIASNINNMDIVMAASHALKYFCMDCSSLLVDSLEQLFNFYNNIAGNLDIQSLYDITQGISHILAEEKDPEKLYNITLMFWKPTLEKLSNYADFTDGSSNATSMDEIHTKIADEIEIITIYVNSLRPLSYRPPENPIAKLLIEYCWPIVIKLISNHGRSTKVSERCAKFIKNAIQNFNIYLIPVISNTAELLVQGFSNYKYGCYLWVSGVFFKEYSDEDAAPQTKEAAWLFAAQQTSTFIQFVESEKNKLAEYPDLIEDFFRMMNDVLMFSPVRLIESDLLQPVYNVAVASLSSLQEFDALIAILHFLIDLYSWGFETPPVSFVDNIPENLKNKVLNFALTTGNDLIKLLIYGLIYSFPSDVYPDASELLTKIIKLSTLDAGSKISLSWIDQALAVLPQGTVNDRERTKLLSTCETAINSKDFRRVRSSIKDFINWYRRKHVNSTN